jgi:hypothetical protein
LDEVPADAQGIDRGLWSAIERRRDRVGLSRHRGSGRERRRSKGDAMRGSDIHGRRGRRSARVVSLALLSAVAMLVAACGQPASEAGAAETPEEAVEEVPEPAEEATEDTAEEPAEAPAEEAEPAEEDAAEESDVEEAPAEEAPPADEETCVIAVGDGTPMDPDSYLELVDPINGALEELLYEVEASLTALEEGGDGPSLETELLAHRDTWEQTVEPVDAVTPADGAEEWHDGVLATWVAVCDAIEDGYYGSAEGDDARFEAFVDALREFPSLFNHLHANAACGPFEQC